MAMVDIEIGGRRYDVACKDGEETHLHMLASIVDGKVREATAAVGGLQDVRALLFAALLLADEVNDLRARPVEVPAPEPVAEPVRSPAPEPPIDPAVTEAMERLADRIEAVAVRLESGVANP
ncbi:cell division protein ZapA [Flavisphingomonas formosensis]|uniref:cell division protein ZapA n=1 Tax=Flavisphingomonas formosensis TaxID=861534 RepID=UPI0012FAC2FC|nr:cell division protein ZapA [Sphingomonas formosensis]